MPSWSKAPAAGAIKPIDLGKLADLLSDDLAIAFLLDHKRRTVVQNIRTVIHSPFVASTVGAARRGTSSHSLFLKEGRRNG